MRLKEGVRLMADWMNRHQMVQPGDCVWVALSGGADSVCLLRLLLKQKDAMQLTIRAVHVNHHLRGAEVNGMLHFAGHFVRSGTCRLPCWNGTCRHMQKRSTARLKRQQEFAGMKHLPPAFLMEKNWQRHIRLPTTLKLLCIV